MKPKNRKYNNPVGQSRFTGLLLISPFIVGFVLFSFFPLSASFFLGMNDCGISRSEYVGLKNYIDLLTDNDDFLQAIIVTLKYTIILVPLKLIVSLGVAVLLNREVHWIGTYRTILYIPSILGSNLAVAVMWRYLFTSDGLVNQFLEILGLSPVGWYSGSISAMSIIVLLRLWEFGSTMIIFLAAIQKIPLELYDAASVDGCGRIRKFFNITLPQLKGVIFFNAVIQTISALQEFNAPFMITGGGPLKSTYTTAMYIYDAAFSEWNVGVANAASWILFVMSALIISLIFVVRRKTEERSK